MKEQIELSIIIVNFNSGRYLHETIRSIYDHKPDHDFEIIVVDNNSTDNSLDNIRNKFPEVIRIELKKNYGFAQANNLGVQSSRGKFILILNNDTKILQNTIEPLVQELKQNPDYGIVSPLLYYGDGTPQLSYGKDPGIITEFFTKYFSRLIFRLALKFATARFEKNVDWISGACFLISSELYSTIGGFDEEFFLYLEDADLGKRIRKKGYLNHVTSRSKLIHFLGKSTVPNFSALIPGIKRGHLHYYRKHNSRISFNILKVYLITKYSWQKIFSHLSGRKERSAIASSVLSAIRGVKFEKDHS